MGTILNEILANFDEKYQEQKELEATEFDRSQFGLIESEAAGVELDRPAHLVGDSLIVSASEDESVLMEKKHPFGLETEDMVEKAHPETVVVADGPGDAGVVENANQQQQKIINMVNKTPTGNVFHHSFASQVKELVVIAQKLDDAGYTDQAKTLDYIAASLATLKKKV